MSAGADEMAELFAHEVAGAESLTRRENELLARAARGEPFWSAPLPDVTVEVVEAWRLPPGDAGGRHVIAVSNTAASVSVVPSLGDFVQKLDGCTFTISAEPRVPTWPEQFSSPELQSQLGARDE